MFTGLIEEIGTILKSTGTSNGITLTISAVHVLNNVILGDSISVNGVCLTVTSFKSDQFTVDLAPETLRLTNLGLLNIGNNVNLERSVTATTRMGGHFVQGHVDGKGKISNIKKDGDSLVFEIEADSNLLKYIVKKGYIAIDGASLTVIYCDERCFKFMLIKYTQSKIVTAKKLVGDFVNIEVDIMGKYIEKFVSSNNNLPVVQEYSKKLVPKL